MLEKELLGHHAVASPYSADDFRLGHEDKAKYFFNRKLSRVLLDGKAKVFQLHSKYLTSYTKSQQFTLRAYRDLLMALALSCSVRSVQSRDTSYVNLTNQTKRYWSEVGQDFWLDLPNPYQTPVFDPDKGMYGLAGSPAFAMYINRDDSNGLLPLAFLQKVVDHNLSSIDCGHTTSASECQTKLFQKLHLDEIPYLAYESALNKADTEGSQTPHVDFIKSIREELLTKNDWDRLKQRLILGEYSDSLIKILKFIDSKSDSSTEFRTYYSVQSSSGGLEKYLTSSLEVLPPAGSPLFYQTMILKGLVGAIASIENVTDSLFDQDISFLLKDRSNTDWIIEASSHLATAYDASAALGMFQTTYEAKGLSYRFFLTALQLIKWVEEPYISEVGPTRLYNFIKV